MNIAPYSELNREAWDDYVFNHPEGTIYHTTQWMRSVQETFNQEQYYHLCIDGTIIKGVMPLFCIKTLFSGIKAVSIPWAMYGGILADSKEEQTALLNFAEKEIEDRGIDFLELRNLYHNGLSLPEQDMYVTYIKKLEQNEEKILQNIPRKSRASVRNGYNKFNLKSRFSQDVNILYHLYLLNKRKLGSPPYPRKFFEILINEFGDNAGILYIEYENRTIAGVLFFTYKDTIYPYFSGSNGNFNFTNSNNLMYFELMKYALKIGLRNFDFGRSRINTGSGKFKQNMGFEPTPLHYYFFSPKQDQIPNINPSNRKFDLISKIWTKLPLPLTEFLGPKIVKRIP